MWWPWRPAVITAWRCGVTGWCCRVGQQRLWRPNECAGRFEPVAGIAAGGNHSLALTENTAPVTTPQTVSGPANNDLPITLSAFDVNGDKIILRVTALPGSGALYQSDSGARGAAIVALNTTVSDSVGRVIFAPAPNQFGESYASFVFTAHDGEVESRSRDGGHQYHREAVCRDAIADRNHRHQRDVERHGCAQWFTRYSLV